MFGQTPHLRWVLVFEKTLFSFEIFVSILSTKNKICPLEKISPKPNRSKATLENHSESSRPWRIIQNLLHYGESFRISQCCLGRENSKWNCCHHRSPSWCLSLWEVMLSCLVPRPFSVGQLVSLFVCLISVGRPKLLVIKFLTVAGSACGCMQADCTLRGFICWSSLQKCLFFLLCFCVIWVKLDLKNFSWMQEM